MEQIDLLNDLSLQIDVVDLIRTNAYNAPSLQSLSPGLLQSLMIIDAEQIQVLWFFIPQHSFPFMVDLPISTQGKFDELRANRVLGLLVNVEDVKVVGEG